jgi:Tol biopolymer transport system component
MALDLTRPSGGVRRFQGPVSNFDDHTPSWSPDGTQLTFASTRSGTEEIWIANIDGSGVRQMTSMGGPMTANPHWSPDGRHIAFNSVRAGSSDLYLLDVSTADIRRLTSWPGYEDVPRWSPDGQWLLFGSGPPESAAPAIYRMPPSGGAAERIVTAGGTAMITGDGRWIYVSRAGDLWRVPAGQRADAAGTKVLTALGLAGQNYVVGRRAAYAVLAPRAPPDFRRPIVAVDHDSGKVTTLAVLAPEERPWYGLALSPDERTLLITVVLRDSLDLMVAEPVP